MAWFKQSREEFRVAAPAGLGVHLVVDHLYDDAKVVLAAPPRPPAHLDVLTAAHPPFLQQTKILFHGLNLEPNRLTLSRKRTFSIC